MRMRLVVFGSDPLVLFLVCCGVLMAGCRKGFYEDREALAPAVPETVTTKSGRVMVNVPPGEFTMGDAAGNDDEKPAHKVRADGFLMDAYEVTRESYQRMTGKNPSKSKGHDKPVERVSWYHNYRPMKMRDDEIMSWGTPGDHPRQRDGQAEP